MTRLYIPIIVLGLTAIGAVHAQSYNYDVKNTQSLERQTGFVALELGGELRRDSAQRHSMTLAQSKMQNETVTKPTTPQQYMMIEPAAGVPVAQPLPVEPVIEREEQVPVVIETQTVIGNSDTGVTPDDLEKALDTME